MRPSARGKCPIRPPRATRFRPLLTTGNESNLTQIYLDQNANDLQMKSLDGFSGIQLGRYCFNLETEVSHRGFRNPRLKLASFSKTNSQNEYSTMLPTAGQDHALIPLKYPEFNKTEI
jgi:hypothetical protein